MKKAMGFKSLTQLSNTIESCILLHNWCIQFEDDTPIQTELFEGNDENDMDIDINAVAQSKRNHIATIFNESIQLFID